jgi:hypothetical protein
MPYLLIPLLQIACVIHVMRTGRDRMWIYLLIFLPGIGVLAYVAAEIIPDFFRSRTGRGLHSQAIRSFDPGRGLRRRYQALDEADTVENRRLLAEELIEAGRFDDALAMYRGIVAGIHADDPGLLMGMANAAYGAGEFEEASQTIFRLGETNPNYHPVEAQLLYARCLEALGRDDDAAREYAQLATHAPGEEVRCRYAMLLQRLGRHAEANAVFSEILTRSKRAPSHYRRRERHWIDIARREATA